MQTLKTTLKSTRILAICLATTAIIAMAFATYMTLIMPAMESGMLGVKVPHSPFTGMLADGIRNILPF